MKRFIGIILIVFGLLVSGLSIREYAVKHKKIEIIGYELSTVNKKSKKIFYRNTSIGLLIVAGGTILILKKPKGINRTE